MGSYKFTYKDVILRHERMINRIEKWEIHVLAVIMLVITAFFTFSTFCFADEEEVINWQLSSNITISPNSNIFTTSTSGTGYFEVESGYIYNIQNNRNGEIYLATSDNVPTINQNYDFIGRLEAGEIYTFSGGSGYFIFDFSPASNVRVTRIKVNSMDSSVSDLVDNVGINQVWDVFGSGINFVYVVVIVAFGIFLIAFAIRKVSKGKSEF